MPIAPEFRDRIIKYFDLHCPPGQWGPAITSQEPYRGDLFNIFSDSYAAGARIHGDAITEMLRDAWQPTREDLRGKELPEKVWQACQDWSEWLYAWEKRDGKR